MNDDSIINKYLKNIITLHQHFNWVVWSLGFFYMHALFNKKSSWFNIDDSFLPPVDSIDWVKGFEWKGLYIKVQSYEKSKVLFNEIKALHYTFFDYLQLIEHIKTPNKEKCYLSNEIIFPLISYCTFSGIVLYVTSCVNKFLYDDDFEDKNNINNNNNNINKINNKQSKFEIESTYRNKYQFKEWLEEMSVIDGNEMKIKLFKSNEDEDISIINFNNDIINKVHIVNEDIDLNDYAIDDLEYSKILKRITKNNLLKIIDNLQDSEKNKFKFMIINAYELIPDLTNYENNKHRNFLSFETEKKYYTIQTKEISNDDDIKKKFKDVLNFDYNESEVNIYENTFNNFQFKLIYKEKNNDNDISQKEKNHKDNYGSFINRLANLPYTQNKNLFKFIMEKKDELKGNLILDKFYENFVDYSFPKSTFIMYQLKRKLKQKYSLINNQSNSPYIKNLDFILHFEQFCNKLNIKANLIRSSAALIKYFHKYGINTSFLIFALPKIKTKHLSDLIQITLFCSILKKFFYYHEGINYYLKLGIYDKNHNSDFFTITSFDFYNNKNQKHSDINLLDIQREKIVSIIKSILFPNASNDQTPNSFNSFLSEHLLLFTFLSKLKWYLIDEEFNFSLFSNNSNSNNNKYSIKNILSHFILSCQENPFVFLSSLEYYFDIQFDSLLKFSSSISIENIKSINGDKITLSTPKMHSYINTKDINSYILVKYVTVNNSFANMNNKDLNNSSAIKNSTIPSFMGLNKPHYDKSTLGTGKSILDNSTNNINNLTNLNLPNNKMVNYNNVTDLNIKDDVSTLEYKKVFENSRYIKKRNLFPSWKEILPKLTLDSYIPPMLFKLEYSSIKDIDNINNNNKLNKYISNAYPLIKFDILNDWKSNVEMIFTGIYSCDGQCENELLLCYVFQFVNFYYIEDNLVKAKEIYNTIREMFKNQKIRTIPSLAIENILKGLLTEGSLKWEEFYSKSLIFALIEYGDMRGKLNKGHPFMMIPLYHLAKQTCKFDNPVTNEFFKEMFRCMKYNIKLSRNNNVKFLSTFDKNLLYFYIEDFSYVSNFYKTNQEKNIIYKHEGDEDKIDEYDIQFGEEKIKDNNYSTNDINRWESFAFPSISDIKTSDKKILRSMDYIFFFVNSIVSLLSSSNYNYISEEIINVQLNIKSSLNDDVSNAYQTTTSTNQQKANAFKSEKLNNLFSHFIYDELMQKMSYKNQIPNGIILSFGINTSNETGQDNYSFLSLPRLLHKLTDYQIKKISCGYSHSIAIDICERAFSWGDNNVGQCGVGIEKIIKMPTPIIINDKITLAHCSKTHSYFLTKSNTIYFCGLNIESKDIINKPIKVECIEKQSEKIISIKSGLNHSLLLTSSGKVFSWGYGLNGQLGILNQTEQYIKSPMHIEELNTNGRNIVAIDCGENHSIAIDNNGDVYGWGIALNGELGMEFCSHQENYKDQKEAIVKCSVVLPKKIDVDNMKIKRISCGNNFTMLISDKDEAVACGKNDDWQLGNNEGNEPDETVKCNDFIYPIQIESFFSMKVIKVSCGENHCLAIVLEERTKIKSVWAWGNNKYGQLGFGKEISKSLPKPISYILGYINSEIEDVSCGKEFSLVLLNRNDKINNENNENEDNNKIDIFINNPIFKDL